MWHKITYNKTLGNKLFQKKKFELNKKMKKDNNQNSKINKE
jgi:hypothetical protein